MEPRAGIVRHNLVPDEHEAALVRDVFRLSVTDGALRVAEALNARGETYRHGHPWTKELVLDVQWSRVPGRAAAAESLLSRLRKCGRCGAAYRLETSGKLAGGEQYRYRYYNCRTTTRVGKAACPGGRIRTDELDARVLDRLAAITCTTARTASLARALQADARAERAGGRRIEALPDLEDQIDAWTDVATHSRPHHEIATRRIEEINAAVVSAERPGDPIASEPRVITAGELQRAWANLIRAGGTVSRNYLHHVIDRIEIADDRITIVPRRPTSASPVREE